MGEFFRLILDLFSPESTIVPVVAFYTCRNSGFDSSLIEFEQNNAAEAKEESLSHIEEAVHFGNVVDVLS